MNTINNLKLRFRVTSRHSDVEDHVCALIDEAGAKILKEKNYGIPTLCDNIIAYGDAGIVSGEYKEGDDNIKFQIEHNLSASTGAVGHREINHKKCDSRMCSFGEASIF